MSSSRNLRRSGTSGRKLAAQIARQMAAVIPNMVAQIHQTLNTNQNNQGNTNPPRCTFKHFNSCNPPKYNGSEGATGLLQWYESMENTFLNSDCPEDLKVRYATSVFQKRALTWWNGEKRTRGMEAAMALSWDEVKNLMTREFCPRNETKKLEAEFWDLKQDSGENLAYTTRFHELSLLVPHLVTPLSRSIEKYIGGLPMPIQDTVWGRDPDTLEDAIRLAATLSDNHVRAGTLTRKGAKKPSDKAAAESSKEAKSEPTLNKNNKKRKSNIRNYAITTPAAPITQVAPTAQPTKKLYTGTFPQCNSCKYHHPTTAPCRQCTNCGRFGHVANTCRLPVQPQAYQPNTQPIFQPNAPLLTYGRACFQCGDPTHFRNTCPKLTIVNNAQANQANPGARGRAFNINVNQAQANNEVVNGTFLVNNHYASILFDTGADKSFVSFDFEPLLAIPRVRLENSFSVEVANGEPIIINSIIRNCTLNLNEHNFSIDLIPMQLGSFDIIVGMDWLSQNRAEVI